jgi:hypothetical protein
VGKLCLFKVISKQLLLFRSSSGGEGGGGRRGEMFQTIYAHMNKWKKRSSSALRHLGFFYRFV